MPIRKQESMRFVRLFPVCNTYNKAFRDPLSVVKHARFQRGFALGFKQILSSTRVLNEDDLRVVGSDGNRIAIHTSDVFHCPNIYHITFSATKPRNLGESSLLVLIVGGRIEYHHQGAVL
jgi:hypothetical protein